MSQTLTRAEQLTGIPHKYSTLVGNGAVSSFTLTPGFSTESVTVQVFKVSTGEMVLSPKIIIGVNGNTQVTLTYKTGDVPTTNQFRVVIVG